jgi:aspartate/methionine/tyrosine aminotransferase
MFSERTAWPRGLNRLTLALEEAKRRGGGLLDLTASNPTSVGLKYDEKAILHALAAAEAMQYHPEPKGLATAREAVAEYYRDTVARRLARCAPPQPGQPLWDRPEPPRLDAERIVLTVSTSEAYSFVFRLLCDPDDEILVPQPSYPLLEYLARLEAVRLVPYPLFYDHGWQIDLHALRRAISRRTRAVVLVHPNNPTGSYVLRRERSVLDGLCAENELALVVDEVFLDYALEPREDAAGSFAYHREAMTFTLSGVSKISGLPQMKLAWIVVSGPEPQAREAMARLEMVADTFLSQNAPMLKARGAIQAQLGERLRRNLAELDRQLHEHPACERLAVEGGWCVILRVPATRSDEELVLALLAEQQVLVQPGYFYDFAQDGYLVLSLITPSEIFREGVRRVLGMVE